MNRMLVAERREAGESFNEIARALGVPATRVRCAMAQMRVAVPGGWKYEPGASWERNVVAMLCEAKREGRLSMDEAWRVAMREMPPKLKDRGTSGALFDEDGCREESVVDFFRRACMNAWVDYVGPEPGQGRALRQLAVGLLDGLGDCSALLGTRTPRRGGVRVSRRCASAERCSKRG